MADKGQSSDPQLPNYSPEGIPLEPGYIELVEAGDPLVGANDEHLNKIKLYAWRGPDYIADPAVDNAGVGWILAENWWPYQRPSFVSPPFAGYLSGHSTFSRAAAEVLTKLTGDEYFPGGVGEFIAPQNEFLVFEEGPSVDVVLQWATYQDASDQTSLSRIWGGIHPPADDLKGRQIGYVIAQDAFDLAAKYFTKSITSTEGNMTNSAMNVYPNPAKDVIYLTVSDASNSIEEIHIYDGNGREHTVSYTISPGQAELLTSSLSTGVYIIKTIQKNSVLERKIIIQ